MVDKSSAVMGLPGETSVPLNADHRDLCRFASSGCQNMSLVLHSIRIMLRHEPNISRGLYTQASDTAEGTTLRDGDDCYNDDIFAIFEQSQMAPAKTQQPGPRHMEPTPTSATTAQNTTSKDSSDRLPGEGLPLVNDDPPTSAHPTHPAAVDTITHREKMSLPTRAASTYALSGARMAQQNRTSTATHASAWRCDGCSKICSPKEPRARCKVCVDHSLCLACDEEKKQSKTHRANHVTRGVKIRHKKTRDDLVPAHNDANPQSNPLLQLPNWFIDAQDRRWYHLGDWPGHARFILPVDKGAYLFKAVLEFRCAEAVDQAAFERLKEISRRPPGIGKIEVVVGTPVNKSEFFRDMLPEDDRLTKTLLKAGRKATFDKLTIGDSASHAEKTWGCSFDLSSAPIIIGMEKDAAASSPAMGCLVRWSALSCRPGLVMHVKAIE